MEPRAPTITLRSSTSNSERDRRLLCAVELVFLSALNAVVHVVLVHDLVCVFVLAFLPHPARERKDLFVGSCEPEKSVSFV